MVPNTDISNIERYLALHSKPWHCGVYSTIQHAEMKVGVPIGAWEIGDEIILPSTTSRVSTRQAAAAAHRRGARQWRGAIAYL